jgi:hypothetical protein
MFHGMQFIEKNLSEYGSHARKCDPTIRLEIHRLLYRVYSFWHAMKQLFLAARQEQAE